MKTYLFAIDGEFEEKEFATAIEALLYAERLAEAGAEVHYTEKK